MATPFSTAGFLPLTGLLMGLLIGLLSCTSKAPDVPLSPEDAAQARLVQRGKQVYQTHCIACHNSNPRQAGSLGPDVWGSSKELLTARILEAKYPPGYAPKKAGAGMPPLPHLKPEIDAIHAYLNAP